MDDQREFAIRPIAVESVQHNARTISNIRSLSASLFGIAAGTLGLESYPGFIFYLLGTFAVSGLVFLLRLDGQPGKYFHRPLSDFWIGDVFGGMMSFILTWTLFFGIVQA